MMGTKIRSFSPLPRDVSLEDLVPTDHFYRRLEADLDLSFVRELVRPLYARGGRPSVDPVVFFKLQLVMFFEGIRSERRLMEVAADRLSVRWYLGYNLFEALPDHSSLTRIRERYGLGIFRGFFEKVVEMCAEAGLVWGKELYFDATKVDADASLGSIAPPSMWKSTWKTSSKRSHPVRRTVTRGVASHRERRDLAGRERRRGRLDLEDGQAAARGKGRLVQAHRRLPVLRDRP
jgi:transposase